MTIKQATDYDGQIMPYRISYTKAIAKGDWLTAIHFIELLNCCLTPAFKINDLPKFELDGKSFNYSSKVIAKAREHCFKYAPMIESAISLERAKLYQSYRQDE